MYWKMVLLKGEGLHWQYLNTTLAAKDSRQNSQSPSNLKKNWGNWVWSHELCTCEGLFKPRNYLK